MMKKMETNMSRYVGITAFEKPSGCTILACSTELSDEMKAELFFLQKACGQNIALSM